MFTARMQVRYRRNVPVGVPLRIVGRAGKDKGRTAEGWAGIYLAEGGDLLAEADVVLINVPSEAYDLAQLDALGWRVYPE
jgi:acyl-CoA thioesterase FadM